MRIFNYAVNFELNWIYSYLFNQCI